MLYLPPGVAHHGVAEGPCFTYSIGVLAAAHADLHRNFFNYLGELLGATDDEVTVAADTGVVSIAFADIHRSNLLGD